jgi:hypothetical protein
MQHLYTNACNIRLKQMKYFEQMLATYATSLIYLCNIHIKQLQHAYETFETLEIYACSMRFHRNISLLRSRVAAATTSLVATTFW